MEIQEIMGVPSRNLTQADIDGIAEYLATPVKDGRINPLDAAIRIRIFKDAFDKAFKMIEDEISAEVDKYGKGGADFGNFIITKRNGGDTAKFDHYDEWVKLNEQIKGIEVKMKAVAKNGLVAFDNDGNEIPAAKLTPKKDSIVFTSVKVK